MVLYCNVLEFVFVFVLVLVFVFVFIFAFPLGIVARSAVTATKHDVTRNSHGEPLATYPRLAFGANIQPATAGRNTRVLWQHLLQQ